MIIFCVLSRLSLTMQNWTISAVSSLKWYTLFSLNIFVSALSDCSQDVNYGFLRHCFDFHLKHMSGRIVFIQNCIALPACGGVR